MEIWVSPLHSEQRLNHLTAGTEPETVNMTVREAARWRGRTRDRDTEVVGFHRGETSRWTLTLRSVTALWTVVTSLRWECDVITVLRLLTPQDPATPLLLDTLTDKSCCPARLPSPAPADDCPAETLTEDSAVPDERIKTLLSFLWLWTGFFATTTSLALTHEKVPDTAPLPDALLDNINYQRWGLDLSEVLLVLNSLIGAVVVFSNIHRLVILRRIWLILGILYYYR